jgi:hypothetical protein
MHQYNDGYPTNVGIDIALCASISKATPCARKDMVMARSDSIHPSASPPPCIGTSSTVSKANKALSSWTVCNVCEVGCVNSWTVCNVCEVGCVNSWTVYNVCEVGCVNSCSQHLHIAQKLQKLLHLWHGTLGCSAVVQQQTRSLQDLCNNY